MRRRRFAQVLVESGTENRGTGPNYNNREDLEYRLLSVLDTLSPFTPRVCLEILREPFFLP